METNIQSSSSKTNTPIPSHLKTSMIRQCILKQYEPKSTTDLDASSLRPTNDTGKPDFSCHMHMSLSDIRLTNEFTTESTLSKPKWNTTSFGNGSPQRDAHKSKYLYVIICVLGSNQTATHNHQKPCNASTTPQKQRQSNKPYHRNHSNRRPRRWKHSHGRCSMKGYK